MEERKGAVTFKGSDLTLVGPVLKVGQPAPECELLGNDLKPVRLSSFAGRICVLASVPSLDTPVCDTEARRSNDAAGKLGPNVAIVTVSMDLPFAQRRWCGAAGATDVITLSDHRDAAFGVAYGVLIKELRLLARAVFLLDPDGVIRRVDLVKEMTQEPDYDSILKAVADLGGSGTGGA